MKPCSAELLTLLATRQFFAADLYTFNLIGGGVLRYCGGVSTINANGFTYTAGGAVGPYFDRTDNKAKCHWKVGTQEDTLVFDVLPGSATIFGTPFLAAVRLGVFAGATLLLERAFMPTYGDTSRGLVRYFFGRVATVDAGRSIATFAVNSHIELMDLPLPRNLYQPGCVNNLGDTACGVVLSPVYTRSGTVQTGSTAAILNATLSGGPYAAGTFDQGTVTFTTGVLAGLSRTVKQCVFGSPDVVSLLGYFPAAPSAGDSFTISFGCDKTCGLPLTTTGNAANGSPALTLLADTAGILPGMSVTDTSGIVPSGTTVLQVLSTSVVMSAAATGNVTGDTFSFQSSNGCAKFDNQLRYRGAPFVPQPTSAT